MSNQIVISSGAKVRSLNGVITGTTGVLDSLPINAANGIPQLDVNGKILVSQLPNSVMEYQGTWNANTNTPTLTNGGAFNQGDVYLCNVAGTTNFGAGPIAFVVGDQVIYSGSIWQKASGSTGTVTSVAVTESGDALTITGSPITTSGTINIGFAGTSAQYVAGNGALVTFPTLTGYVPYTGATANVDLGLYNLYAQNVFANDTSGNWLASLTRDSFSAIGILSLKSNGFTNYLQPLTTVSSARTWSLPDASGTIALTSQLTSGTVTSVGLTMPSAFNVASSPITTSGTLAVTGAGVASQYIRGDGTLADFPSSGGGGSSVSYYLNGGTSQGVIGGVTYYEMSKTADTGTGVDFPKTGDGLIVSFLTDANDPAQLNIPGGNWNYEIYVSMSSNGGTPQLYAELYKYDGTTFTLISTSSNEIIYDGVNLNLYTFAMAVPTTTLTVTDRLAVKLYATNSGGKTTTVHTQNGHLCQVITTFSTGITALNGLTTQVQYLQVGTSGTDFNISSATATHTFNLPTASAANRGALSSADWTTFNNKQPAIGYTPANDALVVHLAGTETITGNKTFNGDNVYNGVNVYNTYQTRFTVGIAINQTLSGGAVGSHTVIGANVNGLNVNFPGGGYNSLNFASTTVGNTYTFPNATGTLALTSDIPSLTGYVTGTGTSGQVTYFNGTSSVTGADNFKFDGTNLMIGNPSSALANLYVYNASAAASFLLKTNSSTAYSEIAVRNYNDTSTSYFRQYSPSTTLSDFGVSRAGLALFFSNYATNFVVGTRNGGNLILGTDDQARVWINSSNGYVGIGSGFTSTNPAYNLDVNGTGRFSGALTGTSATFSGTINANSANSQLRIGGATTDAFIGVSTSTLYLTDWATAAKGLTINLSTGAATFSSSVTAGGLITKTAGSAAALLMNDTSGNNKWEMGWEATSNNLYIYSYGGGISPLRITSGGNVGIGTSSPNKTLTVSASVAGSVTEIYNTRNNGSGDFVFVTSLGSNNNNTSNYHYIASTGGADKMYVYGNGNIVNINNSYGTLSDISLKENIVNATPKLADILKLKVRNFNLIGDETKQIGFIAQEFQEVFPSMVDIDGKTEMKTIKTSVLTPMHTKAIQELYSLIQEQQKQIEELKAKIK